MIHASVPDRVAVMLRRRDVPVGMAEALGMITLDAMEAGFSVAITTAHTGPGTRLADLTLSLTPAHPPSWSVDGRSPDMAPRAIDITPAKGNHP